jgi:hypothetical protein
MRNEFDVQVGAAESVSVRARVINRNGSARTTQVVVRDDACGDTLWLTPHQATSLARFIVGGGYRHPEPDQGLQLPGLTTRGGDDELEVRVRAKDPSMGSFTLKRRDSTVLSTLLVRAAEACDMAEAADGPRDAPMKPTGD